MSKIFISYRRDDSGGYAHAVCSRLVHHFSKDRVFMDVDTIEPGADFVSVIQHAVGECDVLLALIGKRWAGVREDGKCRLDDPRDFVRLEISTALARDIRVIPVLVNGMTMPSTETLPDPLKPLSRRNAIEISHSRFNYDIELLITAIHKVLDAAEARQNVEESSRLAEETKHAQQEAERRQLEAEAQRQTEQKRLREDRKQLTKQPKRKAEEEKDRNRAQQEAERRRMAAETLREAEQKRLREEGKRAEEEAKRKAEEGRSAEKERNKAHEAEVTRRQAEDQLRKHNPPKPLKNFLWDGRPVDWGKAATGVVTLVLSLGGFLWASSVIKSCTQAAQPPIPKYEGFKIPSSIPSPSRQKREQDGG